MIHAIQDNVKHLEMLNKFEPHFQDLYAVLTELENTQDVMFAMHAIRTAQLWVNSCVVTSLRQEAVKTPSSAAEEKPRIQTL
jgi:hypothetical protein